MTKLQPGSTLASRTLATAFDGEVTLPDADRLVHLQFRRYAGCPICNVHLRSVAGRIDEIEAAGVREVVVFHSPADELREYATDLPFDFVADPDRVLYREFGVEASLAGLLRPSAVKAALAGLRRGALKEQLALDQSHLGLPGDFLIAPDGRIVALNYGKHAADQWSVDELLRLAAQAREDSDLS